MSGLWSTVRYGFSPVYWLQVSGIPVIFTERETGLTLPSGYTSEDASLVIDNSAEVGIEQVNRENGTAVSLSLSFKLLDTTTVRTWLRSPSKTMRLTADLSATATSCSVDDSSGWSNGDACYAGLERFTIGTVASSTSCTGLTRATVGTLAYQHEVNTTAQLLTDVPRYWRGRDVTLYASPCDPSGFCTGTALLDDAVMVWRGRLEEGPNRVIDGFSFEASSLDRITDRRLAATVSGKVVSTSAKLAVSKGYEISIVLRANQSNGTQVFSYIFRLNPFEDDADGDLLTFAEIRDRIVSKFADAVSDEGATADVGELRWFQYPKKGKHTYAAKVLVKADATITNFEVFVELDNKDVTATWFDKNNGWSADGYVDLEWQSMANPLVPGQYAEPVVPYFITVQVKDGDPSDVPSKGKVRIKTGNTSRVFRYANAETNGAVVYLVGIVPVPDGQAYPSHAELDGAEAEITFTDTGQFPDMMLRCLHSSGNGERSGSYDTLARGQGYGVDEDLIHGDSFTTSDDPMKSLQGEVTSGGESFSGLFGGCLGLFRQAVVCRPDTTADNNALKLTLIDTAPYGAEYETTIADVDLLSHQDDPVVSVKKADSANVITVLRPYATKNEDGEDRFVYADNPRVDAEGRSEVEYTIPATTTETLYTVAGPVAVSHLGADATTQALEIRVPPWVQAEVGDVVWLNITHPAVWTWSTSPGQPGYTGAARVVGRTIELKSTAVRLTLLVDASVKVTALSPAALVSNYDHATAPTWIETDIKYRDHFHNALTAQGGNVWVLHYQPGQTETSSQKHEISAVSVVAGACRLTVASTSGGHTLATASESTLTLPTLGGGDITSYQDDFAHTDDGTQWG